MYRNLFFKIRKFSLYKIPPPRGRILFNFDIMGVIIMNWELGQKIIDKLRGCKHPDKKYDENTNNQLEYINYSKDSFYEVYKNHKDLYSCKWEQYLHVYDKYLNVFLKENKPVRLLEIGVSKGGSLEIWGEYLPKGSKIIGIDIDKKCAEYKYNNENIEVFIGSASDENFVEKNFENMNFDIIVDDGSHICSDVIKTFELFFPKLNNGGLYIVEDLHASYWKNYQGSYKKKQSSIEYFKNIIDALHFDYILKFNYKVSMSEIDRLKKLNREIASLAFYDSILVIEKYYNKYRPMKECKIGTDYSNPENPVKFENSQFERIFK